MSNTGHTAGVDVITLGCSKNLIDSERVLRMFSDTGMPVRHNPEGTPARMVVINTCGFIGDAKEESINTILEYVAAKERGEVDTIAVMGCLSERYRRQLAEEIPEVDYWYGKFDWPGVVSAFASSRPAAVAYDRVVTTGPGNAYIKIAEGCNRFCAFCAIPLITGRYKSRPIEEIVDEVRTLCGQGIHELNIIAQDLSYYGTDIYGRQAIARLVDTIADVPGVHWIRLHYAYPADFPMELLDVMARRDNVCKYLDIALQHISDKVLTNMRRHITAAETRELLAEIRRRVLGIHLRTTLMVGFPGEDEAAFEQLMDFVRETRFERMGAFAYCEEEDTYAAGAYTDGISDDVKQSRLDRLMALQENISLEIQESKVGSTVEVVIDSEDADYYVGRTQWDSPEVDPEVLIDKTVTLKRGQFVKVRITSAQPFELFAVPLSREDAEC